MNKCKQTDTYYDYISFDDLKLIHEDLITKMALNPSFFNSLIQTRYRSVSIFFLVKQKCSRKNLSTLCKNNGCKRVATIKKFRLQFEKLKEKKRLFKGKRLSYIFSEIFC